MNKKNHNNYNNKMLPKKKFITSIDFMMHDKWTAQSKRSKLHATFTQPLIDASETWG